MHRPAPGPLTSPTTPLCSPILAAIDLSPAAGHFPNKTGNFFANIASLPPSADSRARHSDSLQPFLQLRLASVPFLPTCFHNRYPIGVLEHRGPHHLPLNRYKTKPTLTATSTSPSRRRVFRIFLPWSALVSQRAFPGTQYMSGLV